MWFVGIMAVAFLVSIPLSLFLWYTNVVGIEDFIVDSWTWIGGSHPENIGECTPQEDAEGTILGFFMFLLGLVILIVGAIVVCVAAFGGLGVGIPLVLVGAAQYLMSRDISIFRTGLKFMTIGLSGVVFGGLFVRFMDWFGHTACAM
jgi:hypothetical protein